MGVDEILHITGDGSNEVDNMKNKDAFLASVSDVATWVYDIDTKLMRMFSFDSEGNHTATISIDNYEKNIMAMHLVYLEDEELYRNFCASLDSGTENVSVEYRCIGHDYQQMWFRQIGQTVCDETGRVHLVKGRRYDISREKMIREGQKATQDSLTGLFHRDKAKEIIIGIIEKNPQQKAAYIIIDIDRYHEINDSLGKMQGDTILQSVAGLIYTNFMTKDVVCRIAGDQFLVFCTDIDETKLKELLDNMKRRVAENSPIVNGHPITMSMGYAFQPEDGVSFDILYAKADIALYQAKQLGGNRYLKFDEETMGDIGLGYSLLKIDTFSDEEIRLDTSGKKLNKKLFDFAFDVISKETDINKAITDIFSEVCLHYNLDRGMLCEYEKTYKTLATTAHWSRLDDGNDKDKLVVAPYVWSMLEEKFKEADYLIYENGRCDDLDFFRQIVTMKRVPVSSIQMPIFDNQTLSAMIVLEAFEEHEFKKNEINTILSLVKLIKSYLLNQQVKYELEMESIINKSVLDVEKLVYFIMDKETCRIKYLGKYVKDIFPDVEIGKRCFETIAHNKEQCQVCPLKTLEKGITVQNYDEASGRWYSMIATNLKDGRNPNDVLVCVTDVTDFLAKIRGEDNLTKVASFDKFVVTASNMIQKSGGRYMIVCSGIEEFSKINDEYGYVVGDKVLKRFTELVNEDLSEPEMICRIKGDDFAIIANRVDEASFREYFHKYSERLTREFRADYPRISIKCFAGAYNVMPNDKYVNKCVDMALKARRIAESDTANTGGFYFYSKEIEFKEKKEKALTRMMKAALAEKRYKVYFQPKYDIVSEEIVGAEALVRMQDTDGSMVPPGLFIPLAEKTGLVVNIDESVYDQTFEYIAKWQKEGKKVPIISVNVSRLHLLDSTLPSRIKGICDRHGINTSQVELEITESVFFEDTERLIFMIQELKNLGFVISMDDFGSGYSTLNFMKTMPVDVIKIDGGFFMRNEMDEKSKAIIKAIMQLTRDLNFKTVSEGVETAEQVEFIREQGGRCVQGYYFYKPMPADEFGALLLDKPD